MMEIKDLTSKEKSIIFQHRLGNLYLKQKHGVVTFTAVVTPKKVDESNLIITIHNGYKDTSELVSLNDNDCKELYELLKLRYSLKSSVSEYEEKAENE